MNHIANNCQAPVKSLSSESSLPRLQSVDQGCVTSCQGYSYHSCMAPTDAALRLTKLICVAATVVGSLFSSTTAFATLAMVQKPGSEATKTDPLGNPIGGNPATTNSDKPKTTETGKPSKGNAEQVKAGTTQDRETTLPAGSDAKPGKEPDLELPQSTLPTGGGLRGFQPGTAAHVQPPKTLDMRRRGQASSALEPNTDTVTQTANPTTAATPSTNATNQDPQDLANQTPEDPGQLILTKAAAGEIQETEHGAFRLIQRSSTTWEFGLEITAGAGGPILGVVASAPVPIQWPEQQIKIVTQFKSPSVKSVKVKDFKDQGRQMIVSIPRLNAGETAKASVTMMLQRLDIIKPENRPELKFPEKNNREARMYLGESPYIEIRHPRIQELAATIGNDSDSPWQQVEAIYDWVQTNIKYEFDPNIHSCLEALDAKKGDCEEVASLFIAICRSKGIPARAVWCNDHTYPEFMLCTADGKNVWLPCQITTFEHIFGEMFDDRPILQKGDKFSILGEAAPYRYLKPAMTAKSAVGSPQFRWIIQKVEASTAVDSTDSPLGK